VVIADLTPRVLATKLFTARTMADVEQVIASVGEHRWHPVGDQPGNYGPVNAINEPSDALVEKITNAMDAILELEVQVAGHTDIDSPRAVADRLLGVPRGHLEFLSDREQRRSLASRIVVSMRDGDQTDEPTIVIEDAGIGQHPDEFPNTLVSLNRNNKRDKFYLIGAYGWGGSAALAFSKVAIFISRRDPRVLENQSDDVGWTIIRYNDLAHERTSKTGVYEYLVVDNGSGELAVPRLGAAYLPTDRRDWSGTVSTLVGYKIGRGTARSAAFLGSTSLRNVCNALLFDPVLPFMVREERERYVKKNPRNAQGVIVVGNAARLAELEAKRRLGGDGAEDDDQDEDAKEAREVGVIHRWSYHAPLPSGGVVTVRYWVMGESKKYKKDWQPTRSYVSPDQAVTLTHNGQRHAAWSRDFFEQSGYTSLSKAIVAQVDADDLDWVEKRDLFATTRDRLKQTDMAQTLRTKVKDALREDPWLKDEEKRRRTRALGQESKEQAERIQKMLARAISAYREGDVDLFKKVWSSNPEFPLFEDQPLLEPQRPEGEPPLPDEPAEYYETPTFVRVVNAPVRVPAGGRTVVRLHIDAPDDYFDTGVGEFLPLITRGADLFKIEGYSSLRNGIMRCTISAKGAAPGDRGRIIFTVTRGDDLPITDDTDLQAQEPPQPRAKPAGKQPGKEHGPPVLPCRRHQWPDLGFDETTVAKLAPDPDDPALYTIFVNWDYPAVDQKLLSEKKFDEELASNYKEGFVAAMGFLVWLQHQQGAPINHEELARAAQVHLFTAFMNN
jgi:hypothetical protein